MARISHLAPLLVGVTLLVPWCRAAAGEVEIRDFSTRIDGKSAGEYHMTITRGDDGTWSMSGQADVRITRFGVPVYKYSYQGTEVWKDGQLRRLDSACNDDGKRYTVNAVAEGDSLRVKVNGRERASRTDVWVTTYWRLPDAKQRNQAVTLLDADTGREISGRLQHVGASQINVSGQVQDCAHYRVTGGVQVDLWYDSHERLVRQEWEEDRHKTVLELVGIRR